MPGKNRFAQGEWGNDTAATLEAFRALREREARAQDDWCEPRELELQAIWRCVCGARLPVRGPLRKHRFARWLLEHALNPDAYCGYRRDACAAAQERGSDY